MILPLLLLLLATVFYKIRLFHRSVPYRIYYCFCLHVIFVWFISVVSEPGGAFSQGGGVNSSAKNYLFIN